MKKERKCRKCGEYIPYVMTIDGKQHNLQRRKFCVDCSPLGSRNTRSDDPSIPPKKKGKYSEWSDEQKLLHKARVYKHGLDRKLKLVEMSGGKCVRCGYKRCLRALSFHHLEPEKKEFGLTLNNLWSKSWGKIVTEFKKCELLCVRCHAEEEDKIATVTAGTYKSIIDRFKL